MPSVNGRILGARIPNATVHVVPDAGHLLLMDHADECADLITVFLRSDESAPSTRFDCFEQALPRRLLRPVRRVRSSAQGLTR